MVTKKERIKELAREIWNGPYRFGDTGPSSRMILDKDGRYVCNITIQQIGGGAVAEVDEPRRNANARLILYALNKVGIER